MIRGLSTIFFHELVKRLYVNILEKRVFVYTMQSTIPAYAKGNEKRQKQKKTRKNEETATTAGHSSNQREEGRATLPSKKTRKKQRQLTIIDGPQ